MNRKEFDELEAGDVLEFDDGNVPCNVKVRCGYWQHDIRKQLFGNGLYLNYDECEELKMGVEHILEEDLQFYKKIS